MAMARDTSEWIYVSPVARALLAKAVGDIVALGDGEIEILAITE
jgi:transcription elongation GreA/GreB family factor